MKIKKAVVGINSITALAIKSKKQKVYKAR